MSIKIDIDTDDLVGDIKRLPLVELATARAVGEIEVDGFLGQDRLDVVFCSDNSVVCADDQVISTIRYEY